MQNGGDPNRSNGQDEDQRASFDNQPKHVSYSIQRKGRNYKSKLAIRKLKQPKANSSLEKSSGIKRETKKFIKEKHDTSRHRKTQEQTWGNKTDQLTDSRQHTDYITTDKKDTGEHSEKGRKPRGEEEM